MFKKLLLCLVLALALIVGPISGAAFASCLLPANTSVFVASPQGWFATAPNTDQEVVVVEMQPTAEELKSFSEQVGVDWTDGIIVHDEDDGVYVLVHKKDLDCSKK